MKSCSKRKLELERSSRPPARSLSASRGSAFPRSVRPPLDRCPLARREDFQRRSNRLLAANWGYNHNSPRTPFSSTCVRRISSTTAEAQRQDINTLRYSKAVLRPLAKSKADPESGYQ